MGERTYLPKYNIGVHFLTAKTFKDIPYFDHPTCARIFCEELEATRAKFGFHVLAFVVMSDHLHLLPWWHAGSLPDHTISRVAWAVRGLSARKIVQRTQGVGDDGAVAHPGKPLPRTLPAQGTEAKSKPTR